MTAMELCTVLFLSFDINSLQSDYGNVILNEIEIRMCLSREINFARRNQAIKDNVNVLAVNHCLHR